MKDTLRITRVRVVTAVGKSPKYIGKNSSLEDHTDVMHEPLVRVETACGLEGLGRVRGGLAQVEEELPRLLGHSPLEFFRMGIGVVGVTATELALWDLVAKAQEKPVYALLGQAGREAVDAYDGSLYFCDLLYPRRGVARVREEAAESVAKGYRALKMKIGRGRRWMDPEAGLRRDVECIAAVREAVGPEIKLLVDGNNGFDCAGAIRLFREVGPLDIYWAEEMFPETVEDYRRFRDFLHENGWNTLIADGETQGSVDPLIPLLEAGVLDVLQLNIHRAGLTEWSRLCREVLPRYKAPGTPDGRTLASPHAWSSRFGALICLHLGRAFDNYLTTEIPPYDVDALLSPGIDWYGGQYHLNGMPGWGVVVNERAYQERYQEGEKVFSASP
jgi:L-alanine-DL-glutamate epimerase-like enolase superfamily enzyme